MPHRPPFSRDRPVPGGRLSRLARFGGMAAGIAGNVMIDGAARLASGRRPHLSDLLLTPGNVTRVTDRLAEMRGAAMKIGQLISMDAGDLLPPELSDIMARLRAEADPMPRRQLEAVLARNLGEDWRDLFEHFGFTPIAAASIGQVHRALTKDGRDVAIKVQYPGVRRSIDSDVDNVARLLSLSGLVPRPLDVAPLLCEAKRQLHEEADYEAEAGHLERFAGLLAGDARFVVPHVHRDLSTRDVLAMSYVESRPIESVFAAPQAERDRVAQTLIDLALAELFVFGLMQTDPNLANYRIEPESGRIVLLDFGATRGLPGELVAECRALARAAAAAGGRDVSQSERETAREDAHRAIVAMGLLNDRVPQARHEAILDLFDLGAGFLAEGAPFDFGSDPLISTLRDRGLELAEDQRIDLVPPVDTLFLQRKFGGVYLLALRLKARVDVRAALEHFLR